MSRLNMPCIKHVGISLMLGGFYIPHNLNAATVDSTIIRATIEGHAPYLQSVGAQVVMPTNAGEQRRRVSVGDILEVPTYLVESEYNDFFTFHDLDGDPSALFGIHTSPDGNPGKKQTPIKWFVIKAKPGFRFYDEPAENGRLIDEWNETQIDEIMEIKGFYGTTNSNSMQIMVPKAALGARIGFKILPTAEYGVPDTGRWLKAWDLNYFYKQSAITTPGEVLPDVCLLPEDCGEITAPNPVGPGGIVTQPDYIIRLFDQETDTLITAQTQLLVDHTYYAIILLKDADTGILRAPTAAELMTLQWHIVQIDQLSNENSAEDSIQVASYDQSSGRFVNRSDNPSTELVIDGERYQKYFFSTQRNNEDAAAILKTLEPNFSEQGFGLQVSIDFDQKTIDLE